MSATAEAVRERPILFSGPMVRVILDRRKTQTRRVLKAQPLEILLPSDRRARSLARVTRAWEGKRMWFGLTHRAERIEDNKGVAFRCRYGEVGDLLWVREAWQYADWTEDGYPFIGYEADGARICHEHYPEEWADRVQDTWAELSEQANYDIDGRAADRRWRPSIHMPRWASRLTLRVTDVRVERVQDISEADAQAEGLTKRGEWWDVGADWTGDGLDTTASGAFRMRWDALNAKRGYGWDANPWVWVISFERVATQPGGAA